MTGGRRSARRPGAAGLLLAAAVAAGAVATGCMQTVLFERPVTHDGGVGGSGGGDGGDAGFVSCSKGQLQHPYAQSRWATVVIALDRSTSMNKRFADSPSRLVGVQGVLEKVIGTYGNAIAFGYEEFPSTSNMTSCFDPGGCCAGDVRVGPSLMSLASIQNAMAMCTTVAPSSCVMSDASPSGGAIARIRDFYGHNDLPGDRFVLLITDGEPTCPNDGSVNPGTICDNAVGELTRVFNTGGVKTLVVGVGEDLIPNTTCLNAMAYAGKLQQRSSGSGGTSYYPALSSAQLQDILENFLEEVAKSACHINVQLTSSPDPSITTVSIANGQLVLPDPVNGWTFDPGSQWITLNGSSCATLQADPMAIEVSICTH